MSSIEALKDRLIALDESAKSLRQESSTAIGFVVNDDGKPTPVMVDQARFDEISQAIAAIADEKARIEDKLGKLRELLGPSLRLPQWRSDFEYAARKRSEMAMYFYNKILKQHNPPMLPAEGLQAERWQDKASELAEISETEARIKAAQEMELQVQLILNEA